MDARRKAIHRVLRAWLRLYASMRHLRRRLRRHHGASDDAVMLLRVIAEIEPVPIGELAELTGHHVATLGQMLERMEQAGRVARERDPADRRRVLVRTTAAGRHLADSAALFGPWRLGALAGALSDRQLEELSAGVEWLSNLFSPPETKEDDMPCGTRHGFGRRIHIDLGPDFPFGRRLGERLEELFGGGPFPGFGFARRFRSRRERLERLERYLTELKAETEAVEEEIRELRRHAEDEPSGAEP